MWTWWVAKVNETQKAKVICMTIERLNNIRIVGLDTSRDSNSDRTRTLKTIDVWGKGLLELANCSGVETGNRQKDGTHSNQTSCCGPKPKDSARDVGVGVPEGQIED